MLFFRNILLLSVVVMAVGFFQKDRLPGPSEIQRELLREPVHVAAEKASISVRKGAVDYVIRPLYSYDIAGLVVSYHHSASFDDYYHKEWQDALNSKDIALVYGKNLKNGIYRDFDYKSGSWTAYYQSKPGTSAKRWSDFDPTCFSNNHLVALDPRVGRTMMSIRTGDQIRINGYLVNYGTPEYPDSRRTSAVRTDTGCEVILIEKVDIVRRANSVWRFLFGASAVAALFSFAGLIFFWYRNFCQRLEALKKEAWK
jgi:hypothetical protein